MKIQLFFNGSNLLTKVAFATMMLMMLAGLESPAARAVPAVSKDKAELNMLMTIGMPSADAVYLISGSAAENEIYTHAWTDDPKCTDLPTVTTLAATSVTVTCATLNGIVNPNSGPTNYYFQWGTTIDYGNATTSKYAGSGSSNVNAFSYISGLSSGTTYHFRLIAYNALGTTYGNDEVFVTGGPQPPLLSVIPANRDVMSLAGTTTFSVESNADWTAVSDQPWCTVTPSGTGNGTISASYAENNTQAQRLANITVAVEGLDPIAVMVTQAAEFISVTPQNHDVSYQSGSVEFTVNSNTSWTVTDNQTWCTVTASGTGSGIINAEYSLNSTSEPRVAEITVSAPGLQTLTVMVTQESGPYLSVTPHDISVTPGAGSTNFTITSNISWSAFSDESWCTVTPNGYGDGTIVASYEENTSEISRSTLITISGPGVSPKYALIFQFGVIPSEFLFTLNNIVQISASVFEFDIYVQDLVATDSLEMASAQFGIYFNQGILNGGGITSGMVTALPWSDGFSDLPESMAPQSANTNSAGLIRIAGRPTPGCRNGFIVSKVYPGSRINRFRFTNSVPFTGNSTPGLVFTASTAINPVYATRFAKYDLITCWNTQLPVYPGINAVVENNPVLNGPPELEVAPGSQTVDTTAGESGFTINSNTSWTAQTDEPWVTVTPSGFGDGTMIATYTENTSETRTAIITVSAPGLEDTEVTITQDGSTVRTLNLNLLIEGLYAGNGTMNQAQNENGPHFGAGIADVVTMELHNSSDYAIVEHVASDVEVSMAGNATINLPAALNGAYYITIKHRNSIETTSAIPFSFATQTIDYAFDLPDKAYGGNLQLMIDGQYVIKSGDINQDGSVDTGDMTQVDNAASGYVTGYMVADVNGDGIADTADMTIVDNNSAAYVTAETP